MSAKVNPDNHSRTNRKVEPDLKPERTRARLSQRAIVATASDLFARNGFGATSLDDIGEALGVTKGALYYHVKNKEEILKLIFMTVLAVSEEPLRRIAEAEIPPAEKLHRAITHHVSIAADRSPAMTVFYREEAHLTGPFSREIAARKKDYERLFEKIVAEGMQQGVFTAKNDPKIATFGILGMCNWLSQWYKPGGTYSAEQISAFFTQLVENGLLQR
ncbi:MAG TPA: TetR/AcrR family transcriptional regulator [Chloroflexia bacterium]|nr:TetR/AcrR family transcriptional regulator [Chloroflexia bacterium]